MKLVEKLRGTARASLRRLTVAAIAAAVAGQQFQPVVLQIIRILELVHEDVAEPRLVVFAQGLVAAEHFVRAQQQFRKIDDAIRNFDFEPALAALHAALAATAP